MSIPYCVVYGPVSTDGDNAGLRRLIGSGRAGGYGNESLAGRSLVSTHVAKVLTIYNGHHDTHDMLQALKPDWEQVVALSGVAMPSNSVCSLSWLIVLSYCPGVRKPSEVHWTSSHILHPAPSPDTPSQHDTINAAGIRRWPPQFPFDSLWWAGSFPTDCLVSAQAPPVSYPQQPSYPMPPQTSYPPNPAPQTSYNQAYPAPPMYGQPPAFQVHDGKHPSKCLWSLQDPIKQPLVSLRNTAARISKTQGTAARWDSFLCLTK